MKTLTACISIFLFGGFMLFLSPFIMENTKKETKIEENIVSPDSTFRIAKCSYSLKNVYVYCDVFFAPSIAAESRLTSKYITSKVFIVENCSYSDLEKLVYENKKVYQIEVRDVVLYKRTEYHY